MIEGIDDSKRFHLHYYDCLLFYVLLLFEDENLMKYVQIIINTDFSQRYNLVDFFLNSGKVFKSFTYTL